MTWNAVPAGAQTWLPAPIGALSVWTRADSSIVHGSQTPAAP
jgi:hypothetical protein